MEQIAIDFKNAFDCSKEEKSKVCRSGYVRVVRFMDDKKHPKPHMCEGELMDAVYFAQKAFDAADELWDSGMIGEKSIEEWKNEHMRTPYHE